MEFSQSLLLRFESKGGRGVTFGASPVLVDDAAAVDVEDEEVVVEVETDFAGIPIPEEASGLEDIAVGNEAPTAGFVTVLANRKAEPNLPTRTIAFGIAFALVGNDEVEVVEIRDVAVPPWDGGAPPSGR